MGNVVGYVRVSTQGQAKDGYSLQYQVDEINKFCEENNLNLIRIYEDRGISGAKVDEEGLTVEREGLQNMLADLSHLNTQSVLVLNTSRLWRSDLAKVLIQRKLKRNQVDVKSIEQQSYSIFNTDPNDFLVNGMLELLDQYQRLEITLKLGRGRRKKAEQGGYAGGGIAFGYKAMKGQKAITIDEQKAIIVQRLFELKAKHSDWILNQFAEQLNAEGHRTQQGKAFTKVQIKRILDHKLIYQGQVIYGQIQSEGQHQAII
jgi:DNA invertase Pin-like site-specific DNA recombinase